MQAGSSGQSNMGREGAGKECRRGREGGREGGRGRFAVEIGEREKEEASEWNAGGERTGGSRRGMGSELDEEKEGRRTGQGDQQGGEAGKRMKEQGGISCERASCPTEVSGFVETIRQRLPTGSERILRLLQDCM
eukprot:752616-Hanusia_phi.AAC.1